MNKLLEIPGWKTLEPFNVDKFPVVRPVADALVSVWDLSGEYRGAYRACESRNPGNGIRLVSVVSGAVIDSDCDPVYWMAMNTGQPTAGPVAEKEGPAPDLPELILKLEISPKGLNVVHAEELISPDDVKPGDKIQMFDTWWNVRYIDYYTGSKRFQLQREEDELHPLCDKTCMKVEIHDGLHVRIKRLHRKGGRDA